MKYFLAMLFFLLSFGVSASQKVKRVEVQGDQIVTVRTSPSIATIIQLPDVPRKVVVGNLDAFKVEYLDTSIGVKTFASGVKSNLYIYTEWKRYNVELVSGSELNADYVVYLGVSKKKKPQIRGEEGGIKWTQFQNTLKSEGITLEVNRLGQSKGGILLVEFTVKGKLNEEFKPEWLWLTQNGVTKPIHNLFLSALEVSPSRSISGVLQLREEDVNSSEPIRLELRRSRRSYLTIKKVSLWK